MPVFAFNMLKNDSDCSGLWGCLIPIDHTCVGLHFRLPSVLLSSSDTPIWAASHQILKNDWPKPLTPIKGLTVFPVCQPEHCRIR